MLVYQCRFTRALPSADESGFMVQDLWLMVDDDEDDDDDNDDDVI